MDEKRYKDIIAISIGATLANAADLLRTARGAMTPLDNSAWVAEMNHIEQDIVALYTKIAKGEENVR